MSNTKAPKIYSPLYSNSPNSPAPNPHSQLAHIPFGSPVQKAFVTPKTQVDEAFAQQKMEATTLEIQAKYGSISPEGQERLTVLQAKMDGLLNFQLEHARRFGHNIANIPLHRPDTLTPIQAKLTIGEPGDKYEQEADETARQVVQRIHQPQSEKLQRESLPEEEDELQMKPERRIQPEALPKDDYMQMKPERRIQPEALPKDDYMQMKPEYRIQPEALPKDDYMQMKSMVQRASNEGTAASPDLETSIEQARGGGQPLADSIKSPMEQAFGADFSGVKVHTDTQADQLNQSIQAKAFTTGQDVFFRSGTYEPGSRGGQELLAHELTHVVQQVGSRSIQKETSQQSSTSLFEKLGLMMKQTRNIAESEAISPKSKSIPTKLVPQQLSVARKEASNASSVEISHSTAEVAPNLLQRAITFQGTDDLNTLQTTYPNQLEEINGWNASPYTVTYAIQNGGLMWNLEANSIDQVNQVVTNMLQNTAQDWSTTSPLATAIWGMVSDNNVVALYEVEAAQLFRTHLMLYNHGVTLAQAIGNLYGNVRTQQVDAIAQMLGDEIGRPVIEGLGLQHAKSRPANLSEWARTGWHLITEKWTNNPDVNHRNTFIYKAFDHNKGYSRSINFIQDWSAPQPQAQVEKIVAWDVLKTEYLDSEYFMSLTQKPALNDKVLDHEKNIWEVTAINGTDFTLQPLP